MPAPDKNSLRVRLVLELLSTSPDGQAKAYGPGSLSAKVFEEIPEDDVETGTSPEGKSRAETELMWSTVNLVKAGWLDKIGAGIWRITDKGRKALEEYPTATDLVTEARNRYKEWNTLKTEEKQEQLRSIIIATGKEEEAIRLASLPFVERGLQGGESVFAPGRKIWSRAPLNELRYVFIDAPDAGSGNFLDKLKGQMAEVSDDTRLLMAELVCWQLLPIDPGRIGERKKAERVQTLLDFMDHPVRIPAEISKAFQSGSFDPGMAMNNNIYGAMVLIIGLLDAWIEKSSADKEHLLSDPWAWRDFVNGVKGHSGSKFPTQRNALAYLVHPQQITSIVSPAHKEAIRNAFIGELGAGSGDIDKDLLEIVLRLQQKTGVPANFYEQPLQKQWMGETNDSAFVDEEKDQEVEEAEDLPSGQPTTFPRATPELAQSLFIDVAWLQKQLDLIENRRQVILFGPPGTGKTFVALNLASHIAGNEQYTEIVQFHPSYSYEDFFQGYRPITSDSGALSYELKDGPLRRIVAQAVKNPEYNYVLVIDEINRGNLAKIFGELYFLLEYREQPIKLQYSQDDDDFFTLPKNLFLIGTMNTSDRSIALLDAAMRRRFSFIELHPAKEPTQSVLTKWLKHHQQDAEPAVLLNAVNAKINNSDFQLGPSYLMPKGGKFLEGQLESIWEYDVLPLLSEYHYGEDTDIEKTYGLAVLRAQIKAKDWSESGAGNPAAG